ncbi:hypothetical protein IFM89_029070, partial [Coptis chinensis]
MVGKNRLLCFYDVFMFSNAWGSYFQPLSCNLLRMKVALGLLKGIAFLHKSLKQKLYIEILKLLIYFWIRTTMQSFSILMAKDGPTGDKSHVSTRVMGTYGYVFALSILLQ